MHGGRKVVKMSVLSLKTQIFLADSTATVLNISETTEIIKKQTVARGVVRMGTMGAYAPVLI